MIYLSRTVNLQFTYRYQGFDWIWDPLSDSDPIKTMTFLKILFSDPFNWLFHLFYDFQKIWHIFCSTDPSRAAYSRDIFHLHQNRVTKIWICVLVTYDEEIFNRFTTWICELLVNAVQIWSNSKIIWLVLRPIWNLYGILCYFY